MDEANELIVNIHNFANCEKEKKPNFRKKQFDQAYSFYMLKANNLLVKLFSKKIELKEKLKGLVKL